MPILNVVIDVDGEEGITPQDVEEALNYYFGVEFVISVKEAAQHRVQRTGSTVVHFVDACDCEVCVAVRAEDPPAANANR